MHERNGVTQMNKIPKAQYSQEFREQAVKSFNEGNLTKGLGNIILMMVSNQKPLLLYEHQSPQSHIGDVGNVRF